MKKYLSALFCLFTVIYGASAQQPIWVAPIFGSGNDNCNALHVDASGDVYSVGFIDDTTDLDPGAGILLRVPSGATDVFLQKLDATGNLIWATTFGSTSLSADEGFAVTTDPAGNVYVTGGFYGSGDFNPGPDTTILSASGALDAYVIKFDDAGNFIWAKAFGGSQYDAGDDILIDGLGNIWIIGSFSTTSDFNPGPGTFNLTSGGSRDAYLLKLDSSGNYLWAGKAGGSGFDEAKAIGRDVNNNIYVHGTFSGTVDFNPGQGTFNLTSAGGWESFLWKTDNSGNMIWAKAFGGTSDEYGFALKVTSDQFLYTGGRFKLTADFDPGPGVNAVTAAGGYDGYLAKFDTSGNFINVVTMSGPLYEMVHEIAVDETSHSVFVMGAFDGTTHFSSGTSGDTLVSYGNADIFLAKYSGTGGLEWIGNLGGIQSDFPGSMSLQSNQTLYLNGNYSGTADLDPSSGTWNLTALNSYDPFVEKLDVSMLTSVPSGISQNSLFFYPNPASSNITVVSSNEFLYIGKVLDLTGKTVRNFSFLGKAEINIGDLAGGLYFLEITGNGKTVNQKIVVTGY